MNGESGVGLRRSRAVEWFAYSLAVFLVLFPKGGFKLGSLPITWGYGLMGAALVLGFPFWLLRCFSRIRRGTLWAFLCLAPIQLVLIYSLLVNGVGVDQAGFVFSDFVAFFVLPVAFLAIFPLFLRQVQMERLLKLISMLVFVAAAYGIFLFFWRARMGSYIEIPLLTVNIDDIGSLDDKYNSRPGGLFFKLISTYNNGNQYGVATLLMLPFCDVIERSRFRKIVVRTALILTLSRTVWLGLVLNESINLLRDVCYDLRFFPRMNFRPGTVFRVVGVATLSTIVVSITYAFSGISFLFDRDLGGRADMLNFFKEATILPTAPLGVFQEIIYASSAQMLGWAGVAAIVLLFCSPPALALAFPELRGTRVKMAACQGLVLYIFLAAMDGGLNYIPIMAFYWFMWMLLTVEPALVAGWGRSRRSLIPGSV